MKIETKFNIGDTVWFMYNNKCTSKEVIRIDVCINGDMEIQYTFSMQGLLCVFEQYIFATKEELIASL